MIKIRRGKPVDASNLLRLLLSCHEEGAAFPEPDEGMAIRWISGVLTEGYVLVADLSGRIIGSVGFTTFNFPWSPKPYLYLEWMYVQKGFRNHKAFDAMIAASHAFADERKAPILAGINSGGDDVFVKDRLMKMKGYEYVGGTFIRSEHGIQ